MKRFWLVLLSLGLVLAFSASAMAVDVKFSGSFYAAGMYLDKTSFNKDAQTGLLSAINTTMAGSIEAPSIAYAQTVNINPAGTPAVYMTLPQATAYVAAHSEGRFDGVNFHHFDGVQKPGVSTAFYYQRLRVKTDFIVSPGLKLVTRFDAMERIWGGVRGNATQTGFLSPTAQTIGSQSAGTREENQNIAFDWAYIDYVSPIGLFQVGYMEDNGYGTVFGNNALNGTPVGAISYTVPIGPFYINAKIAKLADNSSNAIAPSSATDQDIDSYSVCAIFVPTKDIQIGLLGGYQRIASGRADFYMNTTMNLYPLPQAFEAHAYSVNPYVKAKFGPIAVEAEVNYAFGKASWENGATGLPMAGITDNVDVQNLTVYANAVADFGMFYGGATFAYVSGDDPTTPNKMEGGFINGGVDFQPCLIMFNSDRAYWAGNLNGYGTAYSGAFVGSLGPAPDSGVLANAWFYQGKVGVRPIAPLDIMASVSYAQADQKPTDVLNSAYGWEVDVTATYKITNNLSYMLGAAYLFTGEYYKGTNNANPVNDNYMLINKLTLTF